MVGVPVAAEVVVADDHVGLDLADDAHGPADGLIDIRLPEGGRVVVVGRAHHPGVLVAQQPALDATELPQRLGQLLGADLRQAGMVLRRIQLGHDDLAVLAEVGGQADHAEALGPVASHDAAGADALVVGVGVDGQEGEGTRHPAMIGGRTRRGCAGPWHGPDRFPAASSSVRVCLTPP